MKDFDQAWLKQITAVNSELEELTKASSLVDFEAVNALAHLNESALAACQTSNALWSEQLEAQLAITNAFSPQAELIKQVEGLYSPGLSSLESLQSQYKEYFDSPTVSAVKAMQAQHEEWLSKTSSVTSVLESMNSAAVKAWETIEQSMRAVADPLKAYGLDSIQEQLALINGESTIAKLTDQFDLSVLGSNTENDLEQILSSQNASILASLEFSNTQYAEAIARANAIAGMYAPINDLVEKYAVMSESIAHVDLSNWANLDSLTGKTWKEWEASPPLELEEDGQKHFKEWFNDLPDPVKIISYFIFLKILEYAIGILVNVTTPYWQEKWQGIEPETPKKQIISTASEHLSPVILANHRFVDVKTVLHVRADAGKKLEVIDTLKRGRIVKLIEKQKAWSLIEYYDTDTEKMIQGWVYSRYLHKFEL
ncbi:SH3 domain-containing protein [Thiomicrospira microaerophila]|uniref:SH3 domain-containing protein n=1 Tax=Thiomicrospira microaerophila TaxID=406020 RepID=UPI002010061C|nr:SH3 domain-containing protein [Thiomicrospira microaerophila]UQB42267.1 SH3 domain-containing protein [Thiomicrospira microaerophila]